MSSTIKQKVYGYVVQDNRLLVFDHDPQFKDAGVQVPGGTVDAGEDLISALMRELKEEAGLENMTVLNKIDEYQILRETTGEIHHRHFYLVQPTVPLSASWTHAVKGSGDDEGLRFHYRWIPFAEALNGLAADLGRSVGKLS